jgi:hypothetical protein
MEAVRVHALASVVPPGDIRVVADLDRLRRMHTIGLVVIKSQSHIFIPEQTK